jgi:hypothetical protein
MTDELKPFSGLSIILELKDDRSNWFDFYRRLKEVLTMNGYANTIKESSEPVCPFLSV